MSFLGIDPIPKKYAVILLFFIVLLGAFLRLYHISSNPPGLYQDETSIGYNAYSILKTGRDEYGNVLPIYFKSFGDYKLPVYIYSTALSESVFGLNEFSVRFPSAMSGILSIVALFFLIRILTKNSTLALIASLIISINPINIFFSRGGFEVNLALFLLITGTYFFVKAIASRKVFLYLSAFCFILSLYSYNVSRLIAPLIGISLMMVYWKNIRDYEARFYMSLSIFCLILLTPFLATFFSASGIFSAGGALITGDKTLISDLTLRSYFGNLPHFYTQLFYSKYVYMIYEYLQNIGSIFSGMFFFVMGDSQPNKGVGNVGFFYLFELPLFIAGIYFFFKNSAFRIFFWWLLISVLTLGLSSEVPQATRGYFLTIPIIVFVSCGVLVFIYYLDQIKSNIFRYLLLIMSLGFAIYCIQFFLLSYFYYFPKVSAYAWRIHDKELSSFIKENESKYKKILIDSDTDFIYSSLIFYTAYPPDKFISEAKRHTDGDLVKVDSWGKYQIRSVNLVEDIFIPNALIIASPDKVPNYLHKVGDINLPTTFNVFSSKGSILSAPETVVKYSILDTNTACASGKGICIKPKR